MKKSVYLIQKALVHLAFPWETSTLVSYGEGEGEEEGFPVSRVYPSAAAAQFFQPGGQLGDFTLDGFGHSLGRFFKLLLISVEAIEFLPDGFHLGRNFQGTEPLFAILLDVGYRLTGFLGNSFIAIGFPLRRTITTLVLS